MTDGGVCRFMSGSRLLGVGTGDMSITSGLFGVVVASRWIEGSIEGLRR